MAILFGFSVGDFITGIELIKDSIDILGNSEGASIKYRELSHELYNL